jgi:hypothetical protein
MRSADTPAKVIARIPKNKRESVVVALDEYMGTQLVHVRQHYVDERGEDRPTAKGVCLNVTKLPELLAGVRAAESEAIKLGLLPGEEIGEDQPVRVPWWRRED